MTTTTIVGPGIPEDFNQTTEIAKSHAESSTEVEINYTQEQRAAANAIATRIVSEAVDELVRRRGFGMTNMEKEAARDAAYAEVVRLVEASARKIDSTMANLRFPRVAYH